MDLPFVQALEAQKNGWFKEEIVPVTIQSKGKASRQPDAAGPGWLLGTHPALHDEQTAFDWDVYGCSHVLLRYLGPI